MAFSLDEYLARIGWPHGAPQPTLPTLRELHLRHACTIAFENLDALLGRTPDIDTDALSAKLVRAKRGGWCYEQNGLFQHALQTIGFNVESLAARVLIANPQTMPPRTHRMMRVIIDDEPWLADVGFGGASISTPLRLCAGLEQRTAHGLYRLDHAPQGWLLCAWLRDGWQQLYLFDDVHPYFSDDLMANHFVATWPDSHFRHRLMASLWLADGGQLRLLNHRLTRRAPDGSESEKTLSAQQVWQCLQQDFGLCMDNAPYNVSQVSLQKILNRFV